VRKAARLLTGQSLWQRGHRVGGLTVGVVAVAISLAAAAWHAAPVSADVPVLTVPSDISVNTTSAAGLTVSFTVSSSDPSTTPTCDHGSGDVFPVGTTTVACTVTNADGTDDESFHVIVTLVDNAPPVVTVPADIGTQVTSGTGASVSFSASANDNLDGSLAASCSPASGATFPIGTTTVTCSATDAHNNTGSASFHVTVTLVDTTAPVVNVPSDIATTTTSPSGKSVSFSASASDNVDGSLGVSCSPASGATFAVGTTTVTCSATDGHSNTGSASFHVTVTLVDTTPPAVNVPSNISTTTTSPSGKNVSFSASASDNVDGSVGVSCSPASGSTFAVGTTTVTCTATDAHSNTGSASFRVTVTLVDTTAPVVSVPSDIATTTTSPSGKSVSFSASASDNLDGSLGASCSPASGATFAVGTTTVTCSATDGHGNTGSASFHVTVTLVDTTPPVVNDPPDLTREASSGAGASVTFSTPTATDNIDGARATTCSRASGSTFPIGNTTVTCSATDSHGNTGSATFHVIVQDTTRPSVSVPGDMASDATSPSGATVNFSASANDTVDGSLSTSCSPASGSTFTFGSTLVTCNATDAHHNTGTATFHVTVGDNTAPSVTVPDDMTREANGPAGALVTFTASATDSFDGPLLPAAVNCLPASGSMFPLGRTIVTCTATDSHGNSHDSSFAVTVVDTSPPRLNVPAAITLTSQDTLPASNPTIAAFLASANATDLADGHPSVTNDAPGSFPLGTTSVKFTAIDKSGNRTTASSSVTVTLTPVAPPPPPDTKPPAAIGKLTARASDGAVTLTWAAPADPDFDHVVLEISSGASPLSVLYTGTATTHTAKGLKNGVEYRFVVVGYDKNGNASAEVAVVATPAAAMLVQPKDGAVTAKPPVLAWRQVPGASYYNVQLYRMPSAKTTSGLASGLKVLSVWPTTPSLRLPAKWVFGKKPFKLLPGTYRWFVWAGFGPRADVKYGPLLGQSTFLLRKGRLVR
jgi:predicted metallo-beta-lactamase superfamily hydrolase